MLTYFAVVVLYITIAGCNTILGTGQPGTGQPQPVDGRTDDAVPEDSATTDAALPTTIGAFEQAGTFPLARAGHASVVAAGRLYIIGGNLCATCTGAAVDAAGTTGNVVSAPIAVDGVIGSFRDEASLLAVRNTARAFSVRRGNKDFLYIVGGTNSTGPSNADAFPISVERAEITSSGLSAFVNISALTVGRSGPSLIVEGDDVFLLGGSTGGANGFVSTIEHAVIDANGGLGPFSQLPQTLAIESAFHAISVVGARVVLLGGATDNSITIADVQVGQLAGAQFVGNFTQVPQSTSTLAAPRIGATTLALDGRVVVFGGGNGQTIEAYSSSEVATVDPLGAFGPGPVMLDQPRYLPSANTIGTRYCVIGGTTAATINQTNHLGSIICAPLE